MPLMQWLHEKIFPAEDKLTAEDVYTASKFAIAEMLRNGIVSFTEMYNDCDRISQAAIETGIKANISRALMLNPSIKDNHRFDESVDLFKNYHNTGDGRIKIDMSLHSEYLNTFEVCQEFAAYTKSIGANMHVHISETLGEHTECIARHNKTPAQFMYDSGVFDNPTLAAHCVHVSKEDMDIFKEKNVSVAHNPVSNLKLGSGVMDLPSMLEKGINVAFGTDGCASNNTHDIMKEMYTAAILHKGVNMKADIIKSKDVIKMATENGAVSQCRKDCGKIEAGCKADLILINLDEINNLPYYDTDSVVYSMNSSNVALTMVDGKILYENGEFTTLDIERLKYEMRNISAEKYGAIK
ncbi:MAG: amidohydrolase, partial [Oscillospiraceae bacterium]|nr:amidohydrolase [Oscillospiraceae bacterium]